MITSFILLNKFEYLGNIVLSSASIKLPFLIIILLGKNIKIAVEIGNMKNAKSLITEKIIIRGITMNLAYCALNTLGTTKLKV